MAPSNPKAVAEAILAAIRKGKGPMPEGLTYYSLESFIQRANTIVREALSEPSRTDSQLTK